jgi:selenocysteine lyase/cysteine desulfurase
MQSFRTYFQLPDDLHYLNCAYMSPLLRSVEDAGITGIRSKQNPTQITPADFFQLSGQVKLEFGKLINAPAESIALIPSASYGLATAVQNLPLNKKTKVILVGEEFPSAYYAVERWCRTHDRQLQIIGAPEYRKGRGQEWNLQILEGIDKDTVAVVMSSIHWADGTLYDLVRIGQKCREEGALFILDGTQSVGALPFDVQEIQPDALICAAYKWLMGPYAIGLAYFGPALLNGVPLEESWMNRSNASNFSELTDYVSDYGPGASRYQVGEFSNFILLPMLEAALRQLLEWDVPSIQEYANTISQPLINFLKQKMWWVEEEAYRAGHLFGFTLPPNLDPQEVMQSLKAAQVHVSLRGKAIRVSFHLYNTPKDVQALVNVLEQY